ncbi:MAG: DUF1553 domain-containing protein [Verrucomicrobiales bacterium]|nr:DUF1553 domain-containing protein [Verrucomicrobiales bacterium]
MTVPFGLPFVQGRRLAALVAGLLLPISLTADAATPGPGKPDPTQHWAYQPIQRPEVPGTGNPVDAFIGATLERKGLRRSPPADARTLVRRIHFDLTGLPPTPAEIDAFERDASPDRYERLVDRLLASPRYGERWGRHWLDVVRYTESQGFEYDRLRDNAWPYRDYVIRSFNADKPYDRFMREQVAGDVLEPVTAEGIIGASLLVSGPWDQAGNSQANATQRAITREEEMDDLVGVVGQTFLGLTINCARCHDHKFDPIPLVDYYRVKAVFDGVKHGERPAEDSAEIAARHERRARAQQDLSAALDRVAALETDAAREALRGGASASAGPVPIPLANWSFGGPTGASAPGAARDGAVVADGRLSLPSPGAYFESDPIPSDLREKTLEAWVSLSDLQQGGGAVISLERKDGALFDALVFAERQPGKWMAGSEGFARTRDLDAPVEDAPPGAWVHVAAVYSGDRMIALYRNGEPYGSPYAAGAPLPTFKAGEARVVLGRRHLGGGRPWLTGAILQAALYDRALSPAEVSASFHWGPTRMSRSELLTSLPPARKSERDVAVASFERARKELAEADKPVRIAYAGVRQQPGPTRALRRGDVKSPGDTVVPSGLSAVRSPAPDFGLASDAPEASRRLRFADWLADPRNPLPPRVLVNRVWQFHFGQGLVSTPSDFGVSGARPSHPELLDWLASEFIASGWSLKALHRRIVTSETYRQSSDFRADAAALDAENQLLWRYPPRRLEGEAVRDAMLSVSGELNLQLGGPSFRPFTTSEYGATFYHLFDKGEPEFNRRTVYRMNINSGKEPLLDAFDCPDPSVKTPRRGVTTTPLQALGLMNSSFVQRQAASLADRALRLAQNDPVRAIETTWRLALGRPPSENERASAGNAAKERGLSHVCWVLLNSTEFVYVR